MPDLDMRKLKLRKSNIFYLFLVEVRSVCAIEDLQKQRLYQNERFEFFDADGSKIMDKFDRVSGNQHVSRNDVSRNDVSRNDASRNASRSGAGGKGASANYTG